MKGIPEFWTNVPGSIKYQVSNYGNFRRKLKNGSLNPIKTYIRKNKWMAVKVDFKGNYKEYYVHKIVAAVFLDAPELGQIIYHKNTMIRDNYAGNIDYCYPKELGIKTGGNTSRSIPIVQIDNKTGEIINFYKSISAAARDNYIHKQTICQVIQGKMKTAAGYKWRRETMDEVF